MNLPDSLKMMARETKEAKLVQRKLSSLRESTRTKGQPIPYAPRRKLKIQGQTWMVFGDVHCHPNHHNRRLEWAGKLAQELEPDMIWDPGDWADMPSLCRYDIGKTGPQFEGRRYWKDINASLDGDERFQYYMDGFSPGRMIRTFGNHEDRLNKLVQTEGYLFGALTLDDMASEVFGWEVYQPGETVTVAGITLGHSFKETRSAFGGGKYPANNCLNTHHSSWMFGHDHRLSFLRDRNVWILGVGCYFDYEHDWLSKAEQRKWSRGISVLRDVRDGRFDLDWWSIERLEARYG